MVFVNHGDDENCEALVQKIGTDLSLRAFAPWSGSSFDLLSGEWIRLTDPKLRKKKTSSASSAPLKKKNDAYTDLQKAVQAMNIYAESLKEASNSEIRKLTEGIRRLMD